MSKRVKYVDTGYEGVVSDKVAEILEKKLVAEIIGDKKPEAKKVTKGDDQK